MKKLVVIATGNAGKVREFSKAFENSDPNLEFKTQKEVGFSIDVEENGSSFQENARIKALAVAEFLKSKQISATVIAEDATMADALATCCMVLGLDAASQMVEASEGVEACLIYDDSGCMRAWTSSGFRLD